MFAFALLEDSINTKFLRPMIKGRTAYLQLTV